jgi:hypothetical protein
LPSFLQLRSKRGHQFWGVRTSFLSTVAPSTITNCTRTRV